MEKKSVRDAKGYWKMNKIFECYACKKDFIEKRQDCCPSVYNNIINISNLEVGKEFDLDKDFISRRNGFEKYEPDKITGLPKHGTLTTYIYIMNYIKSIYNNPAILDFGCALAHGSQAIKKINPKATYIGADIKEDVILAADLMYNDHDYLYVLEQEKTILGKEFKAKADISEIYKPDNIVVKNSLKHIRDNAIDVVILSRTQHWVSFQNYFDEFKRIMHKDSILYIHSNPGTLCDGEKRNIYKYLFKNFIPIKSERFKKGFDIRENISNSIWNREDAYKFEKYDNNLAIKGLFKKKVD